MRTFIFMLFCALTFSTCQKEDNDPCANIVCLNGGFCANGLCNCPEGYTGSDCSLEKTPSAVRITSVTVTRWPATDPAGAGWDFLDGPDLTFQIWKDATAVYESSVFFEDAIQGLKYTFPDNITLDDPQANYLIILYDYDDFDADDMMGGNPWFPYKKGEGFPASVVLDGPAVSFTLELEYDFE